MLRDMADDAEEAGATLVKDAFGMHGLLDEGGESFRLPYGEWIRLFRTNGFVIEDRIEPRPAPGATSTYRTDAALEWARRWPAQCIWRLRRAG